MTEKAKKTNGKRGPALTDGECAMFLRWLAETDDLQAAAQFAGRVPIKKSGLDERAPGGRHLMPGTASRISGGEWSRR